MCCEGTELSDLLASKIDRAQASSTLCLVYKQQTERGLPLLFFPLSLTHSVSHIFLNENKTCTAWRTASQMWLSQIIQPCWEETFNNASIYNTLQMRSLKTVDCERVGVSSIAISGRTDTWYTFKCLSQHYSSPPPWKLWSAFVYFHSWHSDECIRNRKMVFQLM